MAVDYALVNGFTLRPVDFRHSRTGVMSTFDATLKGRYLQFIYPDRSNRAFSHALSIVFNGDTPKHELANSSLRIDILTCKLKTRGALRRPTSKIYAQFIMNL